MQSHEQSSEQPYRKPDQESYQRCIDFWNSVFSQESSDVPKNGATDNPSLDEALAWVCNSSQRILDFGCGNGIMLFLCAYHGTREHLGIDLSSEAIFCAKRKSENMPVGQFEFRQGGVSLLEELQDASFDAIILSNIVDNLFPEDALLLISESARLLMPGGKALVKLNPHLSQEQIQQWGIKALHDDLLDDGLLLWNQTTERWRSIFGKHFMIFRESEVYYPEHDQTNRLFLLIKI